MEYSAPVSTLLGKTLQNIKDDKEVPAFFSTGLKDLDSLLGGGLMEGSITVIAGPASSGKTDLALNIARNIAVDGGHSVEFFTFDLIEPLVKRLISSEIGSVQDIWSKKTDIETVEAGLKKLNTAPLSFLNISPVCYTDLIDWLSGPGADVIVIDNLQQLPGNGKYEGNREQEISDMMRFLNQLARLDGKTLIVTSEVSRTNKLPYTIHDLKDSSSIEFESDNVIMLNPYEDSDGFIGLNEKTQAYPLKVLKSKDGSNPDIINLNYDRELHKFSELFIEDESKPIESAMNGRPFDDFVNDPF